MTLFAHMPHPRIRRRYAAPAATVAGQYDRSNPIARFNAALALGITRAVGSMWCAYLFAALTLVGLPSAITTGVGGIVQWIAQTFLQLVLLSVILLGQNIQAQAADQRAQATFDDAEAILHEAVELQKHLAEQDMILIEALERLRAAS